MLQVPLVPVEPRYLNCVYLTHVFLLLSDHGNLSTVHAVCVVGERLLEMLRKREPCKILKPKF